MPMPALSTLPERTRMRRFSDLRHAAENQFITDFQNLPARKPLSRCVVIPSFVREAFVGDIPLRGHE